MKIIDRYSCCMFVDLTILCSIARNGLCFAIASFELGVLFDLRNLLFRNQPTLLDRQRKEPGYRKKAQQNMPRH